jgi:hypothetical protein
VQIAAFCTDFSDTGFFGKVTNPQIIFLSSVTFLYGAYMPRELLLFKAPVGRLKPNKSELTSPSPTE